MSSFNFDPLRDKIEGFRQRRREQAGLVYKALFVKMAVLICAALALLSLILVARIRKVDGAVGWAEPPIVVLSTSLISVVFLVLGEYDEYDFH
jgi:NO-binding membrane sensor protein with MHYT domain